MNRQRNRQRRNRVDSGVLPIVLLSILLFAILVATALVLVQRSGHQPELPGTSYETAETEPPRESGDTDADSESRQTENTSQETVSQETDAPPLFVYDFPSDIYSRYAILIDAQDGTVYAEKGADTRAFPASVTKIMTVLVALENISDPDAKTEISQELLNRLAEKNAAVAGFRAGESVTARDMVYAALLPSGADGSVGLAELVSGSEERFAVLMNQKAQELGMTQTHFVNATGLHHDEHYSTCRDLAILLQNALENRDFRTAFTTQTYLTEGGIYMESTTFRGMRAAGLASTYIRGGKTGYTPEAGVCLATLAEIGGREYILVTLGAGNGSKYPQYNVMDAVRIWDDFAACLSGADSGKAA